MAWRTSWRSSGARPLAAINAGLARFSYATALPGNTLAARCEFKVAKKLKRARSSCVVLGDTPCLPTKVYGGGEGQVLMKNHL